MRPVVESHVMCLAAAQKPLRALEGALPLGELLGPEKTSAALGRRTGREEPRCIVIREAGELQR